MNDLTPSAVFSSFVGMNNRISCGPAPGESEFYVGEEAKMRHYLLNMYTPVDRGVVTNWDHMEKLWDHTFLRELQVNPADHPILLTEPPAPLSQAKDREKTTEVMFETFGVPSLLLKDTAVLSLLCTGETACTGTVVECGHTLAYRWLSLALCHVCSQRGWCSQTI